GRIHPLLRTALLPHELWAKRHSTVHIRIGAAIAPTTFASEPTAAARTAVLRRRVDALADVVSGLSPTSVSPQPIAPRGMAAAIDANIDALQDQILLESGTFQVFCARAGDLPAI